MPTILQRLLPIIRKLLIMKKVPRPKGITNGGKIRSSSVPSSQSPSMHHVLTDLALYIHQGYPPTCPPAPQTPRMNHGREKHRPFSHQMTRLNISSETSESNTDWYVFFSLCGMHTLCPSLLHISLSSSTFLHQEEGALQEAPPV